MSDQTIPRRIKRQGVNLYGLSLRELLITVFGLALALIVALALGRAPVWLRVGIGVLLAGLTLAIAFGRTPQGYTLEELAIRWIAHLTRPRRMVWRRGEEIPPAELEIPSEPAPEAPAVVVEEQPVEVTGPWIDLGFAMVNAVMLAVMAALTTYLATGGAQELHLWWEYITR